MTTAVMARCPRCGPAELAPELVTLMVEETADDLIPEGRYSFFCSPCDRAYTFHANELVVALLTLAGARITTCPAEALEPHTGPAIGYDDLLDLHLDLAEWVAA